MPDYILYTDDVILMRMSSTETDAQTSATNMGGYAVIDTFGAYEQNQLEVINRVIQVKSQSRQDTEEAERQLAEWTIQRDILLQESDYTQLSDVPLTNEKLLEWRTYRQELRDLFNDYTPGDTIVFPTPPT